MQQAILVIDTNVVVAGLLTANTASPPATILDAMLEGRLLYLLSADLLNEYSAVLRRPRISAVHGLSNDEIDVVLTELVANSIWREPSGGTVAPDRGDDHLWALLSTEPGSVLVTGDRLLLEKPLPGSTVVSARRCAERLEPGNTA